MKRILYFLTLLLLQNVIYAQNEYGKIDDTERISLRPVIPSQVEKLSPASKNLLINKMRKIATVNGLADTDLFSRFVITASIDVLYKSTTSTIPPMFVYTLDVTFYIVDIRSQIIYTQTNMEIKGVGKNETKAYISALKNINPKSSRIKHFVENGKEKIIEYFNDQCDFIIKQAETLAAQKKYENAINELSSVPNVCKDCYLICMDKANDVYKQYIDNKCTEDITKARAAWASFNEKEALDYLSQIFPDTKCYQEAQKLVEEIMNHDCSESLGKAKAAWANRDSDDAAKYLAKIPAFSQCGKDADMLAKEIKKSLDAQAYSSWQDKKEREEKEYNLKYAQFLANPQGEYIAPVPKTYDIKAEKIQQTRELSSDFSKTLGNML
ncbi:MAG: hypothetical protein K8S00_06375, partial [Bacteroidales bacterium]|nr:hypothetical protein [Bacteroidales bacterium]